MLIYRLRRCFATRTSGFMLDFWFSACIGDFMGGTTIYSLTLLFFANFSPAALLRYLHLWVSGDNDFLHDYLILRRFYGGNDDLQLDSLIFRRFFACGAASLLAPLGFWGTTIFFMTILFYADFMGET